MLIIPLPYKARGILKITAQGERTVSYDYKTWPQADFSTLSGNIVIISPKQIKNVGDVPFSFGLIQGNKQADEADTPNATYWTGGAAGIFFDNAPDITTEVSFNGGATWTFLKSAAGLSSNTSVLTANIHTVDSANVPYNGIVLQPGQSVNFLARLTFPQTRYSGRKNLGAAMYVGLYVPGTQKSLFSEGFANVSHARNWLASGGWAWGGTCPGDQIFDASNDTIITGSVDIVKAQTITNGTGVGAATDVVRACRINAVKIRVLATLEH